MSFELVGPASDIAKGSAIQVEIADFEIAHADCWYWRGTRFAKRYSSTGSSAGRLPP